MSEGPVVVFVLGPPGCGKGTQCDLIVKNFGFTHLSAGDVLRAERATGSAVAEEIEAHIKAGTIVPVEVTVKLLEAAMKLSGARRFLIDGFPRNKDNLDGWEKQMGTQADVRFVLFLECTEEVATARAMGRNQGRIDDNLDTLKKRFATYTTETKPVIDHFAALGHVRHVDAMRGKDEVFADVKAAFAAAGLDQPPAAPKAPAPVAPAVVSDPCAKNHTRRFDDGSYYDGDLHGAQQHGEGTYYWPDRVNWRGQPYCLYTGGWAHGCMHGFGCEVGEEGTYVGEYANDERHGRGIFLYKDGSYYVGLWDHDQPTATDNAGESRTINSAGQVLHGALCVSKPTGPHTIVFSGQSYYDGAVDEDGKEHGAGTYVWGGVRNWQQWPRCLYSGHFSHGAMEGEGFYTGKAGTYFGGYKNGRRAGAGVFFHCDGGVYFGTFLDDQPWGKGKHVEADGRVVQMPSELGAA